MADTNQPGISNQASVYRKDSKFVAQLSGWEELCQVIEQVQTITPIEDPDAERLERILELVKCYLNSNIGDIQPLETDNMDKKLHKIKKSMSLAVSKLLKYTKEAASEPSSD